MAKIKRLLYTCGITLLLHVFAVNATISFDPPTFSEGEEGWFTVSWSGILPPSMDDTNDMVLLYTTSDVPVNLNRTAPSSYIYPYLLNQNDWKKGEGKFEFYIPNYKSDVQAAYLRGGNWVPLSNSSFAPQGQILDQGSLKIAAKALNAPIQRVLSYTNDPSTVRITWSAASAKKPLVKYGLSKDKLDMKALAFTTSYSRADMCLPPASTFGYLSPGAINTASMKNLKPNKRYYYVVGDSTLGQFSEVEEFVAPPLPEDTLKMLVIADNYAYNPDNSSYFTGGYAINDLYEPYPQPRPGLNWTVFVAFASWMEEGATNSAKLVSQRLEDIVSSIGNTYHGIAVNGDLSYAYGFLPRWSTWLNNHKKVFSTMPVLSSPGNHEADDPQLPYDAFDGHAYDSEGECAIPYVKFMRPPTDGRRMWYSSDIGSVHFVQLSTEQDMRPGSKQYKFLLNDLRSVDRSKTPWVVVGWHRPMYVDQPAFKPFTGDSVVAAKFRKHIEPLFAEYQVDVIFSGHIHKYTRSCPVLKGTCVGYDAKDKTANGPIHLTTGNAGAPGVYFEYLEKPSWREFATSDYGFGEITVTRTNFTFKLMTAGDNGEFSLADTVTLSKPTSWVPNRKASKAFYDATFETPEPPINKTLFNFWNPTPLYADTPELIKMNPDLADACFGPTTELYKYANNVFMQNYMPKDNWALQAALMTFWNRTWTPPANMSTEDSAKILYSLDYGLKSYLQGGVGGTLPPGCV